MKTSSETSQQRYWLAAMLGLVVILGGCAGAPGEQSTSDGEQMQAADQAGGWNRIPTSGDTACSDGTDYAFYVRPGNPKKLAVYLQGGGACWNLETCDPLARPTYTINMKTGDPARYDGLFNFQRADNPLADHTVVFAPYCSADVHIGAAEHSYERPAAWIDQIVAAKGLDRDAIPPSFTVLHRGFANMQAVLDWTYANVPTPDTVFVSGSSAGSIPSPYYALKLAEHYESAEIIQLGDGAGGYRRLNNASNPNTAWNTVERLIAQAAFDGLTDDTFNYEQLYIRANAAAPRIRMHAYDTAEDDVQLRFLKIGGVEMPSLLEALTLNQADISAEDEAFRSYIAGGELHTILARPEFYRFTVGNRSVRDWVADVIAGREVETVRCAPCDSAETMP